MREKGQRNREQPKSKGITILRTTIRVVEFVPNLLFLAIYAIAMLSPYVSPTKTQVPAFLNLAFGLILLVLVLLWIFYLLRRKWGYFGTYSALILLTSGYIFSYFPIHFGRQLVEQRDLRVMTYNVRSFLGRGEKDDPLVPDMIKAYHPDFIALQEAAYYPDGQPKPQKLKRMLEGYPYIHVHKTQAFLSKYPIKAMEEIEYDPHGNGSYVYLVEEPGGRLIMLVNNHMVSYSLNSKEKEEYKDYIRELKLKDLPKQFMAVKRRLGPRLNQRALAAEMVHRELRTLQEKFEPDLLIVLGDMNDTPMSYTYHQMRSGMRDAYADTGLGLGVSYNDRWMPFRIDHLFYEGAAKAVGSEVPKYVDYSDHNPLIVDFKWKK